MDVRTWREALLRVERAAWPEFLDEHSGLPGARANIELATALAELAEPDVVDALIASDDEYRTFCGAIALGAQADLPAVAARLRTLAADSRWRVREAVAIGLQRLGDADPGALEQLVLSWVDDPSPLVQRAAVAAICEPRLLRTRAAAATAVAACRRATTHLTQVRPEARRDPATRTLRQGLGYCWSVAVAADPEPGLAAFLDLDDSDPDVAWIITQNTRKRRLARLL